jgi:hypothetical protein
VCSQPLFYRRFRILAGGAKLYRGTWRPFALIARMAPKMRQKVYRQKRLQGFRFDESQGRFDDASQSTNLTKAFHGFIHSTLGPEPAVYERHGTLRFYESIS